MHVLALYAISSTACVCYYTINYNYIAITILTHDACYYTINVYNNNNKNIL